MSNVEQLKKECEKNRALLNECITQNNFTHQDIKQIKRANRKYRKLFEQLKKSIH